MVGQPEPPLPCSCCGRRTLTERYDPRQGTGYDVCDHCSWEDDGTSDPDALSSVNHGSMAEYRLRLGEEADRCICEKWPR